MAKSTRKPREAARTAADAPSKSPIGAAAKVTGRDIARRAYDLYLGRGREDGHDQDDWLKAERELRPNLPSRTP